MGTDEIAAFLLESLTILVVWVLVPLIMLGLVALARSMVLRADEGAPLTSARAGGWAGLVLFFCYFLNTLQFLRVPGPTTEVGMSINGLAVLLGTVVGAILLWGLMTYAPKRIVGIVVLLLTFAGLTAFHSYIFLESHSDFIQAAVLGTALGALLHVMLFPETVGRETQSEAEDQAETDADADKETVTEEIYRAAPSRSSWMRRS